MATQQLDRRIRLVYYDPLRSPYSFLVGGVEVAVYSDAEVPDGAYTALDSDGDEWLGFTWSSTDTSVRWLREGGADADLVVTAAFAGFASGTWSDPWPAVIVWKGSGGVVLRRDFLYSGPYNRFGELSAFGSGTGLGFAVDPVRTGTLQGAPSGWRTAQFAMFNPPDAADLNQSREVWASQSDQGGSEELGTISADAAVIGRTLLREYVTRYLVGVDQRASVFDEEGRLWNVRSVRELGRRKLMILDCEYSVAAD